MKLVEISSSGTPTEQIDNLPAIATEIGAAYVSLYKAMGFVRPWLGCFALDGVVCIGTCGFKGPPQNSRVEIAYFTYPEYEGQGYATRMARMLLHLAHQTDSNVLVTAQTLPHENASTSILKSLKFELSGSIEHPEDGIVWEWRLPNHVLQATCESARA